jgi:hypothetical protein
MSIGGKSCGFLYGVDVAAQIWMVFMTISFRAPLMPFHPGLIVSDVNMDGSAEF